MFMSDEVSARAIYMGEKTNKILIELLQILETHCPKTSEDELNLYSALMATQMVNEAIRIRLERIGADTDLIDTAIESAKNQIVLLMAEKNGLFTIKGEEV